MELERTVKITFLEAYPIEYRPAGTIEEDIGRLRERIPISRVECRTSSCEGPDRFKGG